MMAGGVMLVGAQAVAAACASGTCAWGVARYGSARPVAQYLGPSNIAFEVKLCARQPIMNE
jgi:hypothetical protein